MDVAQCYGVTSCDVEAVNRVVLDIEIREHGICQLLSDDEVIGPDL